MNDVLQKLKQLDAEREKLLSTAKHDALKKAEAAVDELNDLGFHYELREQGTRPATARQGTRTPKDEPCAICNFKTVPPHDRRAHRSQEPKRPFTDAELKAKGLAKV